MELTRELFVVIKTKLKYIAQSCHKLDLRDIAQQAQFVRECECYLLGIPFQSVEARSGVWGACDVTSMCVYHKLCVWAQAHADANCTT